MKKLLTVSAAMLAFAFLAGPTLAGKVALNGVMTVEDKAGAFTAAGAKAAEAKFEGVEFKARTHFTVVTVKDIPENKKAAFSAVDKKDGKAMNSFFANWARDMVSERRETGVFTLAFVDSGKFFVVTISSESADLNRHFDSGKAGVLNNKVKLAFESALKQTGADAQATRDGGLQSATDYLIEELRDTTVPEKGKLAANGAPAEKKGGMSILQWVLVIGGGLLVMWLVIGLIRALTGGGGGGGGGNGGGGGGGGGFMSGMMGGLFGAMAGMYLYNSMFGGGMSSASAGDAGNSGDGGGDAGNGASDGNFDNGGEAGGGGGDWGGGGGDAGAGGDWGGGGDAGGGGGGDFGGGGDW